MFFKGKRKAWFKSTVFPLAEISTNNHKNKITRRQEARLKNVE